MAATPAILCTLPEIISKDSIFARIHTVILGGETATSSLLGSWLDAGVRVLVGYGTTETTSMGSVHVVARDPGTNSINPALIGGSIEQSPIWLVNSDFQVIEDNLVEGEIIISGDGISRGYYQDDTKTSDNFVYWNSLRVYKTGDYGRWVRGPAGDRVLEFRGRKDRTVKNGGHLVNLDRDVEDALHRAGALLGLTSVHAAMTENGIVAVVTPGDVDTIALLAKARRTMCSYCIPYRIEAILNFPTSSNGKIQHKRVLEIISTMDREEDLGLNTVMTSISVPQVSNTERIEEQEILSKILSAASTILGHCEGKRGKLKGSDSFFKLGGSSLLAFKFVSALRRLNLHIIPSDLFSCQTFEEIARNSTVNSYSDHRAPILDDNSIITQKLTALRSQARDILGLEDEDFDISPLTSLQLALALPASIYKGKNVNQIKLSYSGTYAGIVERAWRAVWHAKAIFRTEICLAIGCGAQIIHKQPLRKPLLELISSLADYETAVKKANKDVGLSCLLEFIAYYPNPVLETTAASSIPSGIEELTVVLTVHHSLMDGISLQILLDNVELAARGCPLPRSPNSIDSNLELISIQKRQDADSRRFFAEYLKGVRQESSWPKNRDIVARGNMDSTRQHSTIFFRSSVQSEEIAEFAGQNYVSIACIYYTAWAMAMSTIQRTSVVVIGSIFSNRASLPEFENVIGLYMSTLPLVIRLDNKEAVATLLQKIMRDIITVGEYAWARSDQINIGSLMNNLVSLQPPLPDARSYPPPTRTESLEYGEFPLSLLIETNGEFRIMYDNDMFHKNVIQRLGGHFKHALNGILHHPSVGDCVKLNELQETVYLQAEKVKIKRNVETMKQALEESVDHFRNLIAIEDCKGNTLTYDQLDKQTNAIASMINEHLIGTDAESVAIYGDGSAEWLLGLIGILKTSRAFVPLDPKWPMERKAMVIEMSGAAAILIASSEQQNQVPKIAGKGAVVIRNLLSNLCLDEEAARLTDIGYADSVFTIIFTSGTTGAPKGIPTTNRAFLAFQSNPEATMFAAPGRRIAQFMSPAFDVCNEEIFSALLHGATLVLRDPEDPYASLSRVDTATMTPTVLSVLEPDGFPNLEIIYSTGESITSVIKQKFATQKLLYNAYGPAECAISTSFERMIRGDEITIGKPSETARMYILDEQQMHVPKGVQGEIYLGGVQVLQQYINAPEETSLRILPDPWHVGDQMYRTGDYGICGKDDRITFRGRIDRQVKIRGFRVELDVVEQAILSEPTTDNVSQCSVLAIDGTLVAYIKLSSLRSFSSMKSRIDRLRDRLSKALLPSWVPQLIIPINDFPRSINGKVNNTALESLYRTKSFLPEESFQRPFLPSNNWDIEHKLAEAWREVLQLGPNVRLESFHNFFSLGGHSVLAMLLASKLTTIFEVNIAAREILLASSFKEQVDAIESLLKAKDQTPYHESSESHLGDSEIECTLPIEELTELEKQVWLQYQLATTVTAFNISNILTISGQIDYSRLVSSFNTALASDPVLSCNLIESPYGLSRVIRDSSPRIREVEQLDIAAEINFPFNLAQDELIRVHLVRQHEESHFGPNKPVAQIVIVTSHSIADLATLQNLLRLVSAGYAGERVTIHKKPQHLESIQWNYSPSLSEQNFWKSYLAGYDITRDSQSSCFRLSILPCAMAAFHGQSRTREYHGNTVIALNSLIKRLGITHHQVALAIAALLLQWFLDEDDILLGAPNANRSSSLEKDALGQFLDRLPIRVKLNSRSLIKGLKRWYK
ncbi:amp-dependent synthetase ligase [Trichoderma arundinaceum]|uniref:Amp-dependent synthetase ligase n=1 Tax=Trichoderma arundinaceum TaxID=490622 RepID=A0A395NPR6_TRIAR|nr:amp-dependent synthetase ligase [Trichoderma arundinaceum]